MIKSKLTSLMILGLLFTLPFIDLFTSGMANDDFPSYIGIREGYEYGWDLNIYLTEWTQWNADNMSNMLGVLFNQDIYMHLTRVYDDWSWDPTPPQSIWPLTVDLILPENTSKLLEAYGIDDLINYTPINCTFGYEVPDLPPVNRYFPRNVYIGNDTESFAKQHLFGGMATSPYWIQYVPFAPININWTEFVEVSEAELENHWGEWVANTTITAQTDGYLMNVPAYGYIGNSLPIKINITYNSDSVLSYFSIEYGGDMLLDYILTTEISEDTITVTSPVSTSSWEINTSNSITWTSTGTIADVKIDLYLGGVFEREITSNTTNDGEFLWKIPSNLPVSTQYQIKITDVSHSTYYDFSDNFEIIIPTITVTSPISTSSWEINTSNSITWTSTGTITDVKIDLYLGGVFEREITSNTTNDGEFLWKIPSNLPVSTQYQIKITDVSHSTYYDFSDNFEIIIPTITVTSPISTSSWEINTSNSITWTSTGTITDVKIDLYLGGVFEREITSNTTNDGEFLWKIPSDISPFNLYQIKITDASNSSYYDLSDNFEIFVPAITVTSPISTSSWEKGTSNNITWTSTGMITYVKIELYLIGVFEREITSSTINDGEFNWTIPSDISPFNLYQIKITDVSNSSYYDFSDNFEIFFPAITVTSPISTSSWEKGTFNNITWISNGPFEYVKIELYLNGIFEREIVSNTNNDGYLLWLTPSNPPHSTQYQIKITDVSNSNWFNFSANFEIYDSPILRFPRYDYLMMISFFVTISLILIKKKMIKN
ncbi:hypothetical protein LCGC14_1669080 [marine sediment metagenome]|uniref:Yeast cell wall synthesis Kre9/Knh1-like N-terminal domain-containing protein n=1 Tax=marine sediment metagenome TaxID=412755 RepID=A0A0F9HRU6_9ZZZZ